MKYGQTLLSILVLLSLMQVYAFGQGKTNAIDAVVVLDKKPLGGPYFGKFDLGELPVGEKVDLQLKVENPFDVDIEFGEISRSCNCGHFDFSSDVIPANGSVVAKVSLTTPTHQKTPETQAVFGLVHRNRDDGLAASIAISYKLAGLLSIDGHSYVFEAQRSSKITLLRIPFSFSSPVNIENVVITTNGSLLDDMFVVEASDDINNLGFIVGTIPSEDLEDGAINGEVTILDGLSGREDRVFCTVRKFSPFTISPKILRFRRDESSDESNYTARAILRSRIAAKPTDKADPKKADPYNLGSVSVKCSIDGKNVPVKIKKIGGPCYRLQFSLTSDDVENLIENEVEKKFATSVSFGDETFKFCNHSAF